MANKDRLGDRLALWLGDFVHWAWCGVGAPLLLVGVHLVNKLSECRHKGESASILEQCI